MPGAAAVTGTFTRLVVEGTLCRKATKQDNSDPAENWHRASWYLPFEIEIKSLDRKCDFAHLRSTFCEKSLRFFAKTTLFRKLWIEQLCFCCEWETCIPNPSKSIWIENKTDCNASVTISPPPEGKIGDQFCDFLRFQFQKISEPGTTTWFPVHRIPFDSWLRHVSWISNQFQLQEIQLQVASIFDFLPRIAKFRKIDTQIFASGG